MNNSNNNQSDSASHNALRNLSATLDALNTMMEAFSDQARMMSLPIRQTMTSDTESNQSAETNSTSRSGFIDLSSTGESFVYMPGLRAMESDIENDEDTYEQKTEPTNSSEQLAEMFALQLLMGQLRRDREEKQMLTPINRDLAKRELAEWCKITPIPDSLQAATIRIWLKSKTGSFPTLNDLIQDGLSKTCFCVQRYPLRDQIDLVKYFLTTFGEISPPCRSASAAFEFYRLHHAWPTIAELETTMRRSAELAHNPEDFHAKDKLNVPTPNLQHLKAQNIDDEKEPNCALCQESIEKNQQAYCLQPCGHYFHSDPKQCLETRSIIQWLEQHKHCPVCRNPVVINVPDNTVSETKPTSSLIDEMD